VGLLDRFFSPSPDKFARLISARLRQAGVTGEIAYDKEQFCLRFTAAGVDQTFNLGNAFRDYETAEKSEHEALISSYVRTVLSTQQDLPESFEDVAHDLLVTLRGRAYYDLIDLQAQLEGEGEFDIPYAVLAEHLALGLVYDLPTSMRSIGGDDLAGWGVSLYEAIERGKANLAEISRELEVAAADGIYFVHTNDGYGACRMVFDPLIDQFEVRGDCVALVPNRDLLIVTGTEEETALGVAAELAKKGLEENRSITGIAFCRQAGEWSPWLPHRGSPVYEAFKMLEVASLGRDYDEQKQLLDALHEKQGIDIFVASYTVYQHNETGEINSSAIWVEGIDTLLPKTDRVMFGRGGAPGEILLEAAWESVREVCSDLMEESDMYPPRYRLRGFPGESQLRALQSGD
jgi:uncharacterized protein YtpQ (UPF0354 family)